MSRPCRLGLLLLGVMGFGMPASTALAQWGFDPYYTGYTPYYTGYTPYYSGSYYTGYSGYYGPYRSSYAAGTGCSSCQSTPSYGMAAYGDCGCSPCAGNCGTGCASGNCSTGCSTTTNATPSGTMQPVPDPSNSARDLETRLQVIERALNITPPRRTKTYAPDNFNSVSPNRNKTNNNSTTPNPTNDPDEFPAPLPGTRRNGADDTEMFEQNRPAEGTAAERAFKPATETIAIPGAAIDIGADTGTDAGGTVIQTKKPAPGAVIDDPEKDTSKDQGLRLETRITSRAVSPRERLAISGGMAKSAGLKVPVAAAAKKPVPQLRTDAHPRTADIARY